MLCRYKKTNKILKIKDLEQKHFRKFCQPKQPSQTRQKIVNASRSLQLVNRQMIIENKYWILITPSDEYLNVLIDGKWKYYADFNFIFALKEALNNLVIQKKIPEIRISQEKSRFDIFGNLPCELICFTEPGEENKQAVKNVLKKELGIDVYIWKSENQTDNDWSKGGWLDLVDKLTNTYRKAHNKGVNKAKIVRTFNYLLNEVDKKIELINNPHSLAELKKSKIEIVISKIKEFVENQNYSEQNGIEILLQNRIRELELELQKISRMQGQIKRQESNDNEVFNLIAKDEIEEAIKILILKYESINPFIYQELVLISARYSSYKREKRLGLEPSESIANSVRYALTEILIMQRTEI